ncbi:protein kinase [Streptosporangium sp. NPDC049644]|uniref:WD40 repeat domain-containing serine/threonine protein kinase n=1 Tax=Streptosporangium sp. NPDC049644 TaxID=3155507 RepID=UPI00342ED464
MIDALQPGDPQRLGEYWLAGRLGAGGQGVVYDAYDEDGTRVAIKVLHSSGGASQYLKEVRAAQRVASFCTAKILQARLEGPRPYIVSEFVNGLSLGRVVQDGRRFQGDDLHRLAIGVVTALVAIHEAGMIHRDLKPDNILLGPDGPRLIDFGIARTVEMSLTPMGMPVGTPPYMAPEIFEGRRAGAAADVFSWGAIVLFAVTGEHAFQADSVLGVARRVLTADPDLGMLPESLRTLVGAALAKDPLARPTARAILSVLIDGTPDTPGDLMAAGSAEAGPPARWEPIDPTLGMIAEDAYTSLTPEERDRVPEVFLRLVTVGDDGDLLPRPVPHAELFDGLTPPEERVLHNMLMAFRDLVTHADERITLARPAVLRAWPRLRGWLDTERDGLPVHHRIRQAAQAWEARGRRPGDVLGGGVLEEALLWVTTGHRHLVLNRLETEFLNAGTRAQTRDIRRRQALTVFLAALLAVALVATALAVRAQRDADHRRDVAVSHRLTAQSELLAGDPRLSALLAVAAWRVSPTPEARTGMLAALSDPGRAILAGHTNVVASVPFSPDGQALVTGGRDGAVRLRDVGIPGDLPAALCAIAADSLTREEWARYVPEADYRTLCP